MKKFVAFLFLSIYSSFSIACSTFLLSKNGQYVFGRNYDWVTGTGMAVVNLHGLQKTSFAPPGEKTISWVSRYGSISFNQYGKEFPHGGMNEKGLVVELMWLAGTKYPAADSRAALNELQWIQYQLDNCASVEEVLATDKAIRINRNDAAPLHYLVADAAGNAATIEFINGKMMVHKGKDLTYPVLTNTIYKDAVQQVKGSKKTSFGDNSVDRFATACNMIQQFQTTNTSQKPVDYAFNILYKIAQADYTKWSIVYDITNLQIHFTTHTNRQRQTVAFKDFNFSCNSVSRFINVNNNNTGIVSKFFSPLSYNQNKTLLEQSAKESRSHIAIPEAALAGAAAYFNQVRCK